MGASSSYCVKVSPQRTKSLAVICQGFCYLSEVTICGWNQIIFLFFISARVMTAAAARTMVVAATVM